jgi:NAD+ diphosphatase
VFDPKVGYLKKGLSMTVPFQRAYPPAHPLPGLAFWFPFRENKILVREQESRLALIQGDETTLAPLEPGAILYLGMLNGIPCLASEVSAQRPLPAGWRATDIRGLFGQLDDSAYSVAGYASHLLQWQKMNRHCPVCGLPLEESLEQWARRCPTNHYIGYPTVTPAILVLVHDGERVLLAHKPGWGSRYSIIAGFVEPGESLEECVRREVAEEVGVEITDITYVSSQPWPFPNQLMVGFTARYAGGEIRPDQIEIDKADWFRFDQLPDLPPTLSLSRELIVQWVASQQ